MKLRDINTKILEKAPQKSDVVKIVCTCVMYILFSQRQTFKKGQKLNWSVVKCDGGITMFSMVRSPCMYTTVGLWCVQFNT